MSEPQPATGQPDDPYAVSFELILAAGTAKSKAMEAVELAREGHLDAARQALARADDDFRQAHDIQFALLQREAGQDHVDVDIVLVHANDHLTMALMAKENAEMLIELYSRIHELEARVSPSAAPAATSTAPVDQTSTTDTNTNTKEN
ncbi:PTS lactose/cellobiose transporter subunit IIA [Actinomyces ruminis]|uniref:PTS lactose/cellobiose transporter subunit IIA n=1 Tax=Actinomyces ruminis TaxID=1937003 RepID=A0ABX4MCD1_9ACTO|nr:PTS lactose/cellobiose transporter subunit IIA [Actinomyces ruminis]PHP51727.1 PTS lactose/cellobiose transporter subunit IIA [Actinomyces ruminis]